MKSDAHHEGFSRDVEVVASTERSFGFVFGGFFTLVSLWPLLRGGLPRWWALGLAVMFVGIALLRPTLLGPFNRAWAYLGLMLQRIVSPVVLALIYFLTITPIGLLMRWTGRIPLKLRFDQTATTYWTGATPARAPARHHDAAVLERIAMLSFARELWAFIRDRKKFWLLPILVMLAIFGGLIILTQGSAIAPFIYTLF